MMTVAMFGTSRPGPYLTSSEDNGRSWSPHWKLDLSDVWPDGHGWPTRQNIANADGSIVVMCNNYFSKSHPDWPCYAFHVAPDLKTVLDHWLIAPYCHDQSFIRLRSGKWLGLWRIAGLKTPSEEREKWLPYGYVPQWDDGNEGHDYLAITESVDDGRTWSRPRPLTYYMEVPGHIMQLKDGRILATYGVRHYPMGAQAIVSKDQGRTWDKESNFMLAWQGTFAWNMPRGHLHPYPNGHPYSAQREDGKIISSYYRTGDPADYRSTLVEAVIWDPPAA
jgi:hypothetical protein